MSIRRQLAAVGRTITRMLVLLMLVVPGAASADVGPVDAHSIRPGLFSGAFLGVDQARNARKWQPSAAMISSFASKPLRMTLSDASCPGGCEQDILDWALVVHLQAHFGLTERLELALDVPLMRHELSASGRALLEDGRLGSNVPVASASPLDLRIGLRFQALQLGGLGLGLALVGTVPFGNDAIFAGQGGPTLEPRLLASWALGPVSLAANVGYRFREQKITWQGDPSKAAESARALLGLDDELTLGVGAVVQLHRRVGLGIELLAALPFAVEDQNYETRQTILPPNPGCPASTPAGQPCEIVTPKEFSVPNGPMVEVLGGLRWNVTDAVAVTFGGGVGLVGSERKSSFRLLAGLSWQPTSRGPGDRDNDGIPDSRDECPDQPEDKDGADDDDGCPDVDGDGDGVLDTVDRCPKVPEDLDGFEDRDGCPDLDNDGDKIPDATDRCPDKAEDMDGSDDSDGCPEVDNDGDGVPDAKDRCPNEPETKNGYQDDDGCPDVVPSVGPLAMGWGVIGERLAG